MERRELELLRASLEVAAGPTPTSTPPDAPLAPADHGQVGALRGELAAARSRAAGMADEVQRLEVHALQANVLSAEVAQLQRRLDDILGAPGAQQTAAADAAARSLGVWAPTPDPPEGTERTSFVICPACSSACFERSGSDLSRPHGTGPTSPDHMGRIRACTNSGR
eukprot:gene11252-biopygen21385